MHIVIVEDDPDDLEFLTDAILSIRAVKITSFIDGAGLMRFLQSEPYLPSLVIMDYYLSTDNALSILNLLKRDGNFSKIPVFILTSSSFHKEECMKLGCQNYFVKPNSVSEYTDIVNELLV